jgi:glycerol-3-phosphate dehydrogenase
MRTPADNEELFDLAVAGGGIHGVGVAQAAAAAGHSVILLERRAVAAGTSSRSSKLIHGGLRYLENRQWRLVRESLAERERLLALAPELVHLVPFHIPVYKTTSRSPLVIRAGLSLYALLGGLGAHARFTELPRREWESLEGLALDGLRAVYRYHDGQTDDAALCRAVLASAIELGARVEFPAEITSARYEREAWTIEHRSRGALTTARARLLVNAAGPWAAELQARFSPAPPALPVELVGGTHIELEGSFERGIFYVEAPDDRRAVFVMPWKGRTLVGTTETPWHEPPDRYAPSAKEIDYLERTFARYFPARPLARRDAWAGLRVLPFSPRAAFSRPREVMLQLDDVLRPRMLTIYGGKLTGYRLTAEKVLARLAPVLPRRDRKARTSELRLRPA